MANASLQSAGASPSQTGSGDLDQYTGVIVIHGIGDIKRNTTLEQAVNTLAYWFNREAGLALRREGHDRIWLRAEFTDDLNPDAPAARATMNLAAPEDGVVSPDAGARLRLEFREVWWAESFGLPAVRVTLQWAQIQFREQAAHLLIPFGFRVGPSHTAARAPAREISQALTYRPPQGAARESQSDRQSDALLAPLNRLERVILTGVLAAYNVFQYIWKALQWLILTPLLYLLLLLMGPLRLLALIPPLRSTVIAGLSGILDYIMLHWIAPAQVYTLDYARSAGIRERFERELERFLTDKRCERIVVIAHSMGTVVAYEGLTTTLARFEEREGDKPITFICLAQALRRVWLLTAGDPHRLRETLPGGVRWLHFWARYDPVATGPLRAESLPRATSGPDPYPELRARLDTCENVDVVNTDSSFGDHDTYWDNIEQVVGPIARELVAGHPALESLVRQRLATPDEILLRRWRVAWRAFLAVAGGIAAGLLLFRWDWENNWPVGQRVARFLTDGTIGRLAGTLCQPCVEAYNTLNAPTPASGGAVISDTTRTANAVDLSFGAVALGVATLLILVGIPLLGRMLAQPSPTAFRDTSETATRRWGVIALAIVSLVFIALTEILPTFTPALTSATASDGVQYYFLVVGKALAFCLAIAVWGVIVIDSALRRRWGWFATILFLAVPAFTIIAGDLVQAIPTRFVQIFSPTYNSDQTLGRLQGFTTSLPGQLYVTIPGDALFVAGSLALVGLVFLIVELARMQRSWLPGLLIAAPVLAYMFALVDIILAYVRQDVSKFAPLLIVPAALAIALLYGMWSSPASGLAKHGDAAHTLNRALLILSSVSLALLILDDTQTCDQLPYSQCFVGSDVSWVAWAGGALSLAAGVILLMVTAWRRQWVWVGVIPLLLLALIYRWGHEESAVLSHFADPDTHVVLQQVFYQAISYHGVWLAFLTASFAYVFWARFHDAARESSASTNTTLPRRILTSSVASVSVAALLAVVLSLFPPVPVNAALTQRLATQPSALPIKEVSLPGLDSVPAGLTSDSSGNIWFTEPGSNKIGEITSTGNIVETSIKSANTYPDGIVFASGKIWFTEPQAGKVSTFDPSSDAFTEYAVVEQDGSPGAITQGQNGDIWFTDIHSDEIERISTDGKIAVIAGLPPLPAEKLSGGKTRGLVAITSGPDGNLWFVESNANKIGRIVPATGAVSEYDLQPRSFPTAITAGQDGAIWFTESRARKIGRIKPIGDDSAIQHSLYEVPISENPEDIAQGPDGFLWFTEESGNQIGRISPLATESSTQQTVVEYALPRENVYPVRIVTDGKDTLWFTELYRNRMGNWKTTPRANT